MKGVPPEIDDLLWRLAEEGSPAARAEFESRHARYGPELARRIRMVADLREAGKTVVHRPKFSPRPARVSPVPRWAAGSVVALAVLAVGAVAYVVATPAEKASTVEAPPARGVKSVPAPPQPLEPKQTPSASLPQPAPPIAEQAVPEKTPSYNLPRDVRIADTDLTTAIQLVAAGGGLKVTVAPGFKDRKVTLDYRGLNTIDTLKAMGDEYGFSVLEEEEGSVLVLPAREESAVRRIGA